MNFIMIGLLLREALDRLRLNMYLVLNLFLSLLPSVCWLFSTFVTSRMALYMSLVLLASVLLLVLFLSR